MTPSLDNRLDSMARAIQEAILPSLGADQSLAIEQAHLVLGQIGIIRQQLDLAPAFERHEAQAMVALGETLAAEAKGGPLTGQATADLRDALGAAALDTPAAARATTHQVGCAVEALIAASGTDGDPAFKASSLIQVVAAGRATATLERAWNRASGFEAGDVELPDVVELLIGR